MVGFRIVITQNAQNAAAQGANAPATAVPTRSEIGDQIRQSILDATQAAREASGRTRVIVDENGVVVAPQAPHVPGIYVSGGGANNVIPPQAVDMALGFFVMCAVMVIGWPIARAFGRRIERRGQTAALDAATTGQLQRIEQAVDAMAIEIERISESQRFMAKLQSSSATGRGTLQSAERP
jgi:hypothetical protein